MPQIVKRTSSSIYVSSDVDCQIDIYRRGDAVYELVDAKVFTASAEAYYFYNIKEDGLFKVTVTVVATPTDTLLPMFPDLITNMAKEFKSFLCLDCNEYLKDCGCDDLTNEAKKALKYNNLASKILTLETGVLLGYSDIDRVNYQNFLFNVMKTVACKSDALLAKIILEECIKGTSENSELYELLLIIRVIGIYLLELNNSSNFESIMLPIIGGGSETEETDLTDIYELYLYDDWVDCLCKTCIRIAEAITIFESGWDDTGGGNTNLPPSGGDLYVEISSSNMTWNYDLNQAIFNTVFSDDVLSFPVDVKVVGLPNFMILEDTNDVAVNLNQVIPFEDIANYRINHTGALSAFTDSFLFQFSDGVNQSATYTFRFALIAIVNLPPNVINGFSVDLDVAGTALIRKTQLFNEGSVIDPEGDLIDFIKFVGENNISLELWDTISAYVTMNINDVADLSLYTDNGAFLRVSVTSPPTVDIQHYFYLAFRDLGSMLYSNDSAVGNIMQIIQNIIQAISLTFTGGILTDTKPVKNWIPLARVEYTGDHKDLTIANVVQGGYASASLSFLIKPADDDIPWSIYNNSGSLVVAGTTNPTLKTYDIYVFTDVLNDRDISYDIQENAITILPVTTSFTMESIGNDTPIAMAFLEFVETDIADFDYLEVPATWPDDFVNDDALSNVSVDYDESIGGQDYTIVTPGLIGFALYTDEIRNPTIYDSLGNDVTSTVFKKFFDAAHGLEIYISLGVYAPSTLYIRFEF